jgi:uncharacterized protein (TIGR03437 family)
MPVRSLIRVSLTIALLCGAENARAQSLPGTTCSTSVDTSVIRPSEGVAELVSDFVIKCQSSDTPTPMGQPIPRVLLRIYVNTNTTVRLFSTSPDLSEALLLMDEPAPQNQLACPMSPCSIQGTGGGVGNEPNSPYNGSPGRFNIFQARVIAGNQLEWDDLPFDPPPPGRTRTLRITNIRANFAEIANGQFNQIFAFVQLQGLSSFAITNPQQAVGYQQYGLRFTHTTATFPSFFDHNVSQTASAAPSMDFTITFSEGYAAAFKPRTIASHPDDVSSNANQNVPGKSYATASGFYNSSFKGTYAEAGLATQGTRLIAHFQNVPNGVSLFVTEQPINISNTLRVQLVSTGPNGDGPYDPVAATNNGFAPITVYSGAAVAVWEVLSASPTDLESVQFGVAVSFSVDAQKRTPGLGVATVRGSFAPITGVYTASLTDPVPRYIEGAAQPAFTITNHGTPSVAAVVNEANYAAGAPLAPGSVAAIFGTYLTSTPTTNSALPLPTTLGGTTVHINGISAPIYATTPAQVNVQIPWELAGQPTATLQVSVDGIDGDAVTINLADTAPYLFVLNGRAFVGKNLPVQPGSLLTAFCTGLGPVSNQPASGSPALDLTSTTINAPTVTIGGFPAEVVFSGLVPGVVGIYEVSFKLPETLKFGPAIPLQLSIAGVDSNTAPIDLP